MKASSKNGSSAANVGNGAANGRCRNVISPPAVGPVANGRHASQVGYEEITFGCSHLPLINAHYTFLRGVLSVGLHLRWRELEVQLRQNSK